MRDSRNSLSKRLLGLILVLALVWVALLAGVAAGVALDRHVLTSVAPRDTVPAGASDSFKLISEAWNTIDKVYVDRTAVEPQRLTYGAISGMVDALGDTGHSHFMTPEMLKEQRNFTQGAFEGIGAEVQMKDGHVVIVAPLDGSPAQKAGLRPGEIIVKVDSQDVFDLSLTEVVDRILGPAGTEVTLTIMDPATGELRDVKIVRDKIQFQNVTWTVAPGTTVAQVRIAAFSRGVTDDLKQALAEIDDQKLTGIVLDLRNNPGGLLTEAEGVASQFLKDGSVLQERDAGGKVKLVPVQPGGLATDIPLTVLINGGTASASEIVAGALQDAQRARIIGEKSFGTGTVLQEYRLSDGSALLLAFEEWLTPKGRVIWHQGIAPDEEVALPLNTYATTPEAARSMTPDQFKSGDDVQLLRAVESLAAPKTS